MDRMREFAARLGNPQDDIPLVHVAGTKGKGSVTAMISEILREAGFRVGTYTSPHLIDLGERISVDGAPSSPAELAADLEEVAPVVEAMELESAEEGRPDEGPTFFEILTAMCLVRFRRAKVDLGILECGLGGRLDSTNICRPLVSVITNVGYDHTHLLGTTLAEIAREKGGILKPGVPLISGVVLDEPREVLRRLAGEVGAPMLESSADFTIRPESERHFGVFGKTTAGESFRLEGLSLGLLGLHQRENAALAVAVVRELTKLGWPIPDDAVLRGLARTTCPGRIEVVSTRPVVVLDVAHNPAAVQALVETLRACFAPVTRRVVFGTSRDKDVDSMLRSLSSYFDEILLTRASDQPRAFSHDDLGNRAEAILGRSESWDRFPNVAGAWNAARNRSSPEDLVCVTGSFYVAGEAKRLLRG